MKKKVVAVLCAGTAMLGIMAGNISQANAAGSNSANLPNTGAVVQANAWVCNAYWTACSWRTSAKALKNGNQYVVAQIRNVATLSIVTGTLSVAGGGVSGTITDNSDTKKTLQWTNTNSWISDLSGTAGLSLVTIGFKACSDAWVETLGVHAGASACD
jgi:hypothetical protein